MSRVKNEKVVKRANKPVGVVKDEPKEWKEHCSAQCFEELNGPSSVWRAVVWWWW